MDLVNFGGAPYFFRMLMIRAWSVVSNAFARSAKTTNVSRLCCLRRWSNVFRV